MDIGKVNLMEIMDMNIWPQNMLLSETYIKAKKITVLTYQ